MRCARELIITMFALAMVIAVINTDTFFTLTICMKLLIAETGLQNLR